LGNIWHLIIFKVLKRSSKDTGHFLRRFLLIVEEDNGTTSWASVAAEQPGKESY
jgi:hypothetical protein